MEARSGNEWPADLSGFSDKIREFGKTESAGLLVFVFPGRLTDLMFGKQFVEAGS